MVLSHSKLKRKRKEDLVAVLESGGAIPQTSPSAIAAPKGAGERKKKKTKTKKEMKIKKQTTNGSGDVDLHLSGTNGAIEDTEVQLWKEVEASKETRKIHKKEKKEEKKKRKAAEREAVTAQIPSSTPESDAHQVENRTDEAVDKAEQPADENGAVAERPMSVREKKGKKKKGAKDRWGVKIADVDQVVENPVTSVEPVEPVEPGATQETPSTSTSTAEELYDLKKVFVGGMPYYATEDDIHDYFSECGVISELDCMTFPDTGNFRGIAFITFKTEEGAAKSLEYDGADMGGRFLKIEKCKLKPRAAAKDPERGEVQRTPGSTSGYIGNLSWDVTEDVIKNFFKKSFSNSKIDSIRLAFDKDTGDFKGFGHVDFGDDDSLEAAVKLNQTPLLGRPMKIAYSVPPKKSFIDGGNRNGNDSKSAGSCYTCGEEGHKAFLCPKKGANANGKFESGKVAACYSCGEEGHKSFLCPKKKTS